MRNILIWFLNLFLILSIFTASPVQADVNSREGDTADTAEKAEKTISREEMELLIEAAQKGNPRAKFALGVLYLDGNAYISKDVTKALQLLSEASDNDVVEASALLGLLYLTGEGAEQDFAKSCEYLGRAARKGHPSSQYLYAVQCVMGLGREADIDEGRIWMNAAAENGDRDAQEFLRKNPEWIK